MGGAAPAQRATRTKASCCRPRSQMPMNVRKFRAFSGRRQLQISFKYSAGAQYSTNTALVLESLRSTKSGLLQSKLRLVNKRVRRETTAVCTYLPGRILRRSTPLSSSPIGEKSVTYSSFAIMYNGVSSALSHSSTLSPTRIRVAARRDGKFLKKHSASLRPNRVRATFF